MIRDYVSLDLETTGLDPKKDKIIEIGAVRIRDGVIKEHFSCLLNPGRILSETVTGLTGIKDEELKDAPYIEEVIEELLNFIGDDILLGHSVLFDFSFVKRAAVNRKLSFEKKAVDTLKIARKYLPQLESRSLSALCKHYGITYCPHRAYEDAVATHELYLKLYEEFGLREDAESVFAPCEMIYQVKREGPATPRQKERLTRLIEERKIVLKVDVNHMTKNEASRITDYILSGAIHKLFP